MVFILFAEAIKKSQFCRNIILEGLKEKRGEGKSLLGQTP